MSTLSPGTIRFAEVSSTPSTPDAGYCSLYVKTDNVVYILDSSGVETPLGSSSAITSLTGEATGTGPGATVVTLSNSAVIGKVLTGFAAGPNSAVLATDSLLQAIEKLQAQVSASSGTAVTSLTGDVTGTGPGATATTVVSVGGSSAANIHSAELAANAATSANTASTIVKRDASGNFAANVITASLNGNASTATTTTNFSGSLAGDVTGTQGATVVATVGGQTAASISQSVIDTQAATSINTASTIVKRDASGNFASNIITAALIGNVTGNVSGSSATFTGSLSGDVTGTQSATAISNGTVTGKLLTGYSVGANTPILSTDSILIAFEKTQSQLNATSGTAISALTGDVTAAGPGSVPATVNFVGGSTAAAVNSGVILANNATSGNFPNQIAKRDGSGNIIATLFVGDLSGNAATATTAVSFSGSLAGDVTGTQSATSISSPTVTGKLLTGYTVGANTAITATDSVLLAFEKVQGQLNATSGAAITALTGDVVATGPGSAAATIQSNVVSNSKLAQMPSLTIKGNNTGSTANALDLTETQVVTMFGGTPVTQIPDQSNTAGTAIAFSRADHVHNIPSGVPVQIGTTNVQGSAATFSLSDHVHSHGNQTVGTLHAIATPSTAGFMSTTDKIKLNAISAAPGTNNQILVSDGTNLNPVTVSGDATITNTGVISVNSVTGTIPVSKGGTGQTSYTAGSIIFSNGTVLAQDNAAFFWNDTNQSIGIGTNSPTSTTFIDGVNTTAAAKRIVLTGYGTGSTVGTRGRFARGSLATPAAAQSTDILNFLSGQGYGASQFPTASTGSANFVAGETFTNTSNQTYFTVSTTPTGSVTSTENFRVASTGLTLGPQTASTSVHQINGGMYRTTRTITGNLVLDTTTTDDIIFCNMSGAISITLPAPVIGRVFTIIDIAGTANTNNITLIRHASEKIEGLAASKILQTNWGSWNITTNGTDWFTF